MGVSWHFCHEPFFTGGNLRAGRRHNSRLNEQREDARARGAIAVTRPPAEKGSWQKCQETPIFFDGVYAGSCLKKPKGILTSLRKRKTRFKGGKSLLSNESVLALETSRRYKSR